MLISIILPVYNVESYLEDCLVSVLHEYKPEYEIIVVNDGSTDRSNDIILRFQQKYPQIILINKENGGLSSARNAGMEIATSKYLLFIDSDDLLEPGVLDLLLNEALKKNADIAVADYYEFEFIERKKFRNDKSLFTGPLIEEEERLNKLFTIDISFAVWNKLYRADFLRECELKFLDGYWFEDLDFVFRAFYNAKVIVKQDGMLIGYRQRSGSIMKSISTKILDKMEIMTKIADFLKSENKFQKYEDMYRILYLKMAFSVIFSCVKNSSDKMKTKEVLQLLFKIPYFKQVINTPLKFKSRMNRNEIIFYNLIKIGLINPKSLLLLAKII